MLAFMQEYLNGKSIVFENQFKADGAKKMIVEFKEKAQDLMDGKLLFPTSPKGTEMLLSLCEPKEDNAAQTNYSKSMQPRWYVAVAPYSTSFSTIMRKRMS